MKLIAAVSIAVALATPTPDARVRAAERPPTREPAPATPAAVPEVPTADFKAL